MVLSDDLVMQFSESNRWEGRALLIIFISSTPTRIGTIRLNGRVDVRVEEIWLQEQVRSFVTICS